MNIKVFHIFFIILSTLLAFGFGLWAWTGPFSENEVLNGLASLVSFAVGLGLMTYGINVWKKFQKDEFKGEE
jgi:hypothetical protein